MHKTEPHLRLSVRNSFSTILLSIQACQSSSSPCSKVVKVLDFRSKCLPYSATWDLQLNLLQHHIALQETDDPTYSGCVGTILLCQHKSVYTLGTATTAGSGPFTKLLADGSQLEYETFNVERAGQATYHGPGQIVLYPILDLNYFDKDIHRKWQS
jgi:lipoyl(octanoyl) transferase